MLQLTSGSLLDPFGILSGASNTVQNSVTGFVSGASNTASNVAQTAVNITAQAANSVVQTANSVIQAKIAAASQFVSFLSDLGK